MSVAGTQLDSRVQIVTPENIAFEYRLAGPFARIGAYLLDLVIITATVFISSILYGLVSATLGLPGFGGFAMLVTMFVVYWFYGGLFEWWWNGQTPGKRATGLRVLRVDGRPVTARQAVLRNLLRYIDLYPYVTFYSGFDEAISPFAPTCLFGLTAMAWTTRYQRIGDLACGTMVVSEEPSGSGRAAKDWMAASETARDPQLQAMLAALPASYRPSRTLARALSHYASRRRYLGPARRREIARHVGAPLVEVFGLPPETDHDLLLSALYARTFLSEPEEEGLAAAGSPDASLALPDAVPDEMTEAMQAALADQAAETPRFQETPVEKERSESLFPKPPTPTP